MQFILLIFTFLSLLFPNTISLGSGTVNAGETIEIDLLLDNPNDVIGGFQFQITDLPNNGQFINASPTDRVPGGFQVQYNEQTDGSVIVVGFDLNLEGIQPGSGSILTLEYQSTGIYSSEVSISFIDNLCFLSDLTGLPLEFSSNSGVITVLGEDPPPIQTVTNLVAVGGYGSVSLSWDDPNVVEITGYHIFRDGVFVGTATSSNYNDSGLQQGTGYCYNVSAFNDNNESEWSEEACASTTEIYLEEPQDLTATENGLEVFLDWDVPPSGIGIGDPCVDAYGYPGFLDCYGVCFPENLLGWIGDGFCDGLNADWGINFSCPEWECDGCDCAGLGQNSDECIEECGSFQNNNGGSQGTNSKQVAEGLVNVGLRDLIGYEIFRDNVNIAYTEETEYLDVGGDLWYLEEFCYNVVSVWDEGTSGYSNTACVTPQLNGPSALSAQGTGSFITLGWTSTPENDQTHFNIYRDDVLLASVESTSYEDYDTEIGQEYCYSVKAYYEGIGESPSTNVSCTSWDVYAPSQIEAVAGDQFVDLTWEEPVGGEEVSLQYDDGVLANAFYFFGTYEEGLAHGTKFDVGVDFDVLAVSAKILSEGDEFWPWPNATHGPIRLLVFDDMDGVPGNLLYESEATAEDGWATAYPNLTGLSGSFYVIISHDVTWPDPEGYGVDASVDYPDNMVTLYYGAWNYGDYLGYGGDYMIASQVFAYGDVQTLSYSDETPSTFDGNREVITSSVHNGELSVSNGLESHPIYETSTRDLLSFDIYRDGTLIDNVGADVFSYRDEPLNNFQEYCYSLSSNYDEGASESSDLVCATPYPGPPATELEAIDLGGTIGLDWVDAIVDPLFEVEGDILLDYQIYRDDVNIGSSTTNSFVDESEIIAGIEYCYDVRANYPSGETFASNLACAVYVLDAPMTVQTEGDNVGHGINVTWSAPGTEGTGETIESPKFVTGIPFEDFGTTIGFMDDYDEECPYTGSTSPDVVYQWAASPGTYYLSICDSDYDTKIYVYDENQVNISCVDDSCNDPAGNPYRSDINLTINDAGLYYVVIDGYGGQSGNYNFSITEGAFVCQDSTPQPEKTQENIELYTNNNYQLEIFTLSQRDLLGYRVYRDDVMLVEVDTNTFEYFDATAEHDVIYCYTVKAVYDDGESVPSNVSCNQWILPPATDFDVTGTNGQVELMWTASNSTEVEGYSVFRDGMFLASTVESSYNDTEAIHNTEYCYYVVANYGDLGDSQPTDEECGMWEILSPDEVFAIGEDGVVHVTWTDPPAGGSGGIGGECELVDYYGNEIEGFLDCIEQCIDPAYLTWLGDGLCDDGSWGVFFNCDEFNWDEGDCPEYANGHNDGYEYRSENQLGSLAPFNPDNYTTIQLRDLLAFNIYRDGNYLAQVESNIYEYDDYEVENLTEYCYTVTSVYEVGESAIDDEPVCATPIPGVAPTNLYAYADAGTITLEWVGGSNQVEDYNIYRDGTLFSTSLVPSFTDNTAEHDVEYCYVVSANYPSGESQPTNESCAMWILAPPLGGVWLDEGSGFIQVNWSEPGVSTCADEVITSLPFNAIGSNVGMTNDWLVQGSEGADYAYLLLVNSPTVIDITLCSANTTYDTKLEIFTADQDCNETTTGNYIDDATCEFSSLQSSLYGVSLQPGEYYIVVDGYGGGEGQYEINVSESGIFSYEDEQPTINDYLLSNVLYEEQKSNNDIELEDWNIAFNTSYIEYSVLRDLNGFTVYRDNNEIAATDAETYSYLDLGLDNGTQYCYYVVANYDEGDSQPTDTVCGAPDAGPMCPPENLVLDIQDGDTDIGLSWDFPDANCEADGGGDGGGDDGDLGDCADGEIPDCSGDGDCCPETWIGDGFGDCEDQAFGCDLTCYDNDGGDCGGLFNENHGTKEHLHANDNNSRIEGFNIYKDNVLLDWVPTEQNTYTDSVINFGNEYCYKITALYEEGESNPTNIECGSVTDPGDFSVVALGTYTAQSGNQVTISLDADNQFEVAGFQFWIEDNPNLLTTLSANTTPRSEGFTLDFNEQPDGSVIVVGFNLTGGVISVGSGSILDLTYQVATVTEQETVNLNMIEFYLGDSVGGQIPAFSENGSVIITTGPVSGCTDENACNYNPAATIDDGSCDFDSCVGCTDSDATNYNPDATIDDGSCNYIVLSISDITMALGQEGAVEISLENEVPVAGFQFNVSDSPDLLSFIEVLATDRTEGFNVTANEINNEVITLGFSFTGDVVAAGSGPIVSITYAANTEGVSTLSLSSITLSDPTGQSLPVVSTDGIATISQEQIFGCTDSMACNFNSQANADDGSCEFESCAGCTDSDAPNYNPDATIDDGSCTYSIPQILVLDAYALNSFSFNVDLSSSYVSDIFSNSDILLAVNDNSEYFVPEYSVDQMGSVSTSEGYKVFLNGNSSQTLLVEGLPVDLSTSISLDAYTFNLLPFLPQECMNTADVFAGYEDQILVVKSDNGEYFVPIYNVATLDEMCPGEGYAIFLNGANGIDFMYPMGTLASVHNSEVMDDYKSSTRRDDIAVTGESHLVLVTGMTSEDGIDITEGDILRAYANDELVGSINIVNDHINGAPIDLVAHGSVDLSEFGGPVLDGYIKGDEINLSYYSRSTRTEYNVEYDFDLNAYGEGAEMSVGGITVLNELENPTSFKLSQNYPNPFNPSTMIEYNVEHSGLVSLKVYDIMGRLVRTLIDGEFKSAGNADGYRSQWNGVDDKGQQVAAGLYIYRLESGSMAISNKMILLK